MKGSSPCPLPYVVCTYSFTHVFLTRFIPSMWLLRLLYIFIYNCVFTNVPWYIHVVYRRRERVFLKMRPCKEYIDFTDQQQTLVLTTTNLQKQAVYIPLHPARRQEAKHYTGLLFRLNTCNNCFWMAAKMHWVIRSQLAVNHLRLNKENIPEALALLLSGLSLSTLISFFLSSMLVVQLFFVSCGLTVNSPQYLPNLWWSSGSKPLLRVIKCWTKSYQ